MAKVMKSYRLEQFTLNRLTKLCKKWDLNETSTIELLITEAYLRECYLPDQKKEGTE